MKYLALLMIVIPLSLFSQTAVVEGAIHIGAHKGGSVPPGTIQWSGSDFLGWNGTMWKSLTQMIEYDGSVMDADSNIYPTIIIGNQEWMGKNLATTKYADGSNINIYFIANDWANDTQGAYTWTGGLNTTFQQVYGYLYNWFAVDNSSGLCPTGWRVPSDNDWDELFDYLNGFTINEVGGKLKEKRTAHWLTPNRGATNEVGFSALPGGQRSATGTWSGRKEYGRFWSSSEESLGSSNASRKYMWSESPELYGGFTDKNNGYHVRCMRDLN